MSKKIRSIIKKTRDKMLKYKPWYKERPEFEEHHRLLHGRELTERLLDRNYRIRKGLRVIGDYAETHTILTKALGENLKGKKILHIAASRGVYVKYLKKTHGANAIAFDIDQKSLALGKKQGKINAVQGDAVPEQIKVWNAQKGKYVTHGVKLPFQKNSLDAVVSEHFLFSNFHTSYDPPGFEKPYSIEKSSKALREYNQILKIGGKLIISSMHPSQLTQLSKFKRGIKINGFIVEYSFTPQQLGSEVPSQRPLAMILKKVEEIKD